MTLDMEKTDNEPPERSFLHNPALAIRGVQC